MSLTIIDVEEGIVFEEIVIENLIAILLIDVTSLESYKVH